MQNEYDIIVVGSGNAGLMAALTACDKKKSVLLLESNNTPGGLASSFVRGNFEFEASLRALYDFGSENNKGNLRKLFDEYEITNKIDWLELPEAFRVIKTNGIKEDYTFPFGIDEFIKKMEQYVPESKEELKLFFDTAKEIHDAYEIIKITPDIDDKEVKKNYPNFYNNFGKSIEEALKKSKLNPKIKEIITSLWIFFGVSTLNLDYCEYIHFLYNYLENKAYIPKNRSFEISSTIEKKIRDYGGTIWFNEKVDSILVENNEVTGIKTQSNKVINSKNIIVNTSPINLYSKMIDKSNISINDIKLTNSRKLGLRVLTIYLGLDKSAEELNLKNYLYIIYNSLDSNIEIENMKKINSNTLIASCLNKANPEASHEGSTILTISAYFSDDVWDKYVNERNYFTLKEKLASNIIDYFESATESTIKDHIEEIEISSPITYSLFNNAVDGCIYGFNENTLDNKLLRIVSKEDETSINGLHICGSYSYLGHGFNNTFINGHEIALKTISEMEANSLNEEIK